MNNPHLHIPRRSRFARNRRRRDPSLMIAIYCLSAVAVISTLIAIVK